MAVFAAGPVVVGEFRGGRGETAKRFDKSDKNAPPLEFGMYKMNLEMLADGSPVMVTVFLDKGTNVEEFGAKVQIKRGLNQGETACTAITLAFAAIRSACCCALRPLRDTSPSSSRCCRP